MKLVTDSLDLETVRKMAAACPDVDEQRIHDASKHMVYHEYIADSQTLDTLAEQLLPVLEE